MNVVNALTIDVEDYFQIHAFSDVIRPEDWDSFEPRVESNTHRLLDLLDSVNNCELSAMSCELGSAGYQPRATFFVLGWVAERFPNLVREIHARGHEVACHGYAHRRIFDQAREEFKEDVRRSKEILENVTGTEVIGYRAPTYSINKNTIWALEILCELGFLYDSSIFPIKHDFYGFPEAPRFPFYIDFSNGDLLSQLQNPKYVHKIKNDRSSNIEKASSSMPHVHPVKFAKGDHFTGAPCPMPDTLSRAPKSFLFEFPITTIRLFRRNIPCSGGGYFRLLPYWLTRWGFRSPNERSSNPRIFYIHPWELDPEIPRINEASLLSKFRTYVNLKNTENKFKNLLSDFQFLSLASLMKELATDGNS